MGIRQILIVCHVLSPSCSFGACSWFSWFSTDIIELSLANALFYIIDKLDSLLQAARDRIVESPGSETEIIAKNPETYAFAAMAAYMNQNPPEGHDRIIYVGGLPFKPKAIFKS